MMKTISVLPLLLLSFAVYAQDARVFSTLSVERNAVCATTIDNEVACAAGPNRSVILPPTDLPAATKVGLGKSFACAILTDGGTQCWGDNGFGQLDAPANAVDLIDIDGGGAHTCGLDVNGAAICWGLNDNNRATPPDPDARYIDISLGNQHTCAVKTNGDVDCWGANVEYVIAVPTDLPPAVSIESDFNKSCILDVDGNIHCWGFNEIEIPNSGPYVDVAFAYNKICGLTQNGIADCRVAPLYGFSEEDAINIEIAASQAGPFSSIDVGGGFNSYTGCGITLTNALECWEGNDIVNADELANPVGFVPTISANIYSDSTVELLWDRPESQLGASNIAGYEIHRNNDVIAMVSDVYNYLDTTLTAGTSYTFQVRTINNSGVVSEFSNAITLDTGDRTSTGGGGGTGNYVPPPRPTETDGLEALVYSASSVELVWNRPDAVMKGYEIRLNGSYDRFTDGNSVYYTELPTDTNHQFDVIAIAIDGSMVGYDSVTVALGSAMECR